MERGGHHFQKLKIQAARSKRLVSGPNLSTYLQRVGSPLVFAVVRSNQTGQELLQYTPAEALDVVIELKRGHNRSSRRRRGGGGTSAAIGDGAASTRLVTPAARRSDATGTHPGITGAAPSWAVLMMSCMKLDEFSELSTQSAGARC